MEESWKSKFSRWKNNPDHFRKEWFFEIKKFVCTYPRANYAAFLLLAGYAVLCWVD